MMAVKTPSWVAEPSVTRDYIQAATKLAIVFGAMRELNAPLDALVRQGMRFQVAMTRLNRDDRCEVERRYHLCEASLKKPGILIDVRAV